MISKQFKSIREQIDILRSKGMIIEDEEFAKDVLVRENYFFLNGYRFLLMTSSDDKKFLTGTRFEELYAIFMFDRGLRNVLFRFLLVAENNLKSIVSYQLSKKYGYREKDYLKPRNYTDHPEKQRQLNDLLKKMKRQIRVNGKQHSATMHYIDNYGYIPLWVLVKVLSFGLVSELFSVLKKEDQQDIASVYQTPVHRLLDYFPILANYRNLCAHEDLVYCNRTLKSIDNTWIHDKLEIPKVEEEYLNGKNDLFALMIIFKEVLSRRDFNQLIGLSKSVIDVLNSSLTTIPMQKVLDEMGFSEDWEKIMNISEGEIDD